MRALGLLPALALCAALARGAGAAADAQAAAAAAPPPPLLQQQMINLSLMEALIAVDKQELVGVFGFIPEAAGPAAFADYLLHDEKALKKFLKKGRRDLKEVKGVNEWDRLVAMYLIQITTAGALPPGVERLSKKVELQVSDLVLATPLTLQEMTARRGGRRP